jgi:hypothetical protein
MKKTIATAAIAASLAAGGIAGAAIPDATGTVHACYRTTGGLLTDRGATRIVEEADDCRSYERSLSWGQQGPQGEVGPPGAAGAAGAAGPQGPAGLVRTYIVDREVRLPVNTAVGTRLDCGGDRVMSGGFSRLGGGLDVIDSAPETTSNWLITVFNGSAAERTIRVYAVCADITG